MKKMTGAEQVVRALEDEGIPFPVVAHSAKRRSASALSAASSGERLTSSLGLAGSGPAGARRASGPSDSAMSAIVSPMPSALK